jgi:hypothetical protein
MLLNSYFADLMKNKAHRDLWGHLEYVGATWSKKWGHLE